MYLIILIIINLGLMIFIVELLMCLPPPKCEKQDKVMLYSEAKKALLDCISAFKQVNHNSNDFKNII